MTKAKAKAAKGMVWLVGGRFGSAILSVISTAVLARLLTPSDFGIVAAAFVVLALANVLFDGAFGINLMRKKELRPQDIRTTLTTGLLLGLILVAVVICGAPAAETFFGFPGLGMVLAVASVTIPFKAIVAISSAKLQRDGRFKFIALASLLGQFAGYILVAVPMALMGAKVWALVAAMVVSGAIEAAAAAICARLSFRPGWDRQALKDVLGTSLFSVANVMNWVANTGANAIVGKCMGAADLGLYSRSWKLLDLVVHATATPLGKVLLPSFSKLNTDEARLRNGFLSVLALVIPAYAVASVLLALQAPLIVYLALGSQWGDTVPVAQILFATLVPRCAFKISETFAFAVGKSAAAALRQGLYAFLMVGGCLIGVRYGITGVGFAVSAAITLFYIASMTYTIRIGRIPIGPVMITHVKSALLAGIVGATDFGVLMLLDGLPLIATHLAGGAAGALAALILLAVMPKFWLGADGADSFAKVLEFARARTPLRRKA